ncbi:VOC family protein [Bacillus atrophaeus]|uniref:VOC family protein n=1 Tax=Bacillus atrophaeus TaxID=1452 RepID=UPI001C62E098|nr:VOC family protein [Bacillus atrophaeus]MCY8855922.1 VOC family protein [Bacillus atrophaeus]MCY8912318.1 VOC family protein [Bacillus atrophaeus]MCY9114184.1 VOC family protein [Bacillus atrophaeus]MCY9205619.1 VOC family protein [Bacillus atrophaeus]MEC0886525.1 VOC family protein [Bacillus atrophaeus]
MHHIELYVSDLEASKRFWGWFLGELGYEPFQKWDSGISWKKDDFYLVFVQAEERFLEQGFHRRRIGLNHLAFHAESREQVDMMTEKLLERGYHVLYRDRHPYAGGAHYAVYAEDPDRIKVELVAPGL